jgi:anti-sigma B factor antagonist
MILETEFSLAESSHEGVAVLAVGGEADVVTAPQIRDALFAISERSPVVIVDFTDLSFIDSTALGVLIVARKRFGEAGGEVRLVGLQPHIRKVFDITGLTESFPIHVSLDEAAR